MLNRRADLGEEFDTVTWRQSCEVESVATVEHGGCFGLYLAASEEDVWSQAGFNPMCRVAAPQLTCEAVGGCAIYVRVAVVSELETLLGDKCWLIDSVSELSTQVEETHSLALRRHLVVEVQTRRF